MYICWATTAKIDSASELSVLEIGEKNPLHPTKEYFKNVCTEKKGILRRLF